MTSPANVAAFHADYDRHHPGDRVRLFAAVSEFVPRSARVLYPGSYVDIGPSVWFDDVTYVDVDKRAARFFDHADQVVDLVTASRQQAGADTATTPRLTFHHADYTSDLAIDDGSVDLVVSLFAGFIGEHCTRYLRRGGLLLANDSHGDASMASLDPRNDLIAVLENDDESDDGYRIVTSGLEAYLRPKNGVAPTADDLHATNRGVSYIKPAVAYIFRHG